MTVSVFPRIIRDGLVVDFDPAYQSSFDSRENLLIRSDIFDSGFWFKDNCTVTANSITAPNGTLTGDTIVSTITGGNNNGFVNQVASSLPTNTIYTYSVYVRRGTSPTTLIDYYVSSPYTEVNALITWGATPSIAYGFGGAGTSGTLLASSFDLVENEWYRVSLTISTGTGTALNCRVYVRGQGTNNISGETVHVWGAQLERSRTAGAYTATVDSPTTRSTSVNNLVGALYPGTLVGGVAHNTDGRGSFYFNQSVNEGITMFALPDTFWNAGSWTVSAWGKFNSVASDNGIVGHGGASLNNGLHLGTRGVNVYFGFFGNDLNSSSAGSLITTNRWHHIVWAYDNSQKQKLIYFNGRLAVAGALTGAVGYSGTGSNTTLGYYPWPGNQQGPINGWLGRVQLYNRVLAAPEVSQIYSSLAGRYIT